MIKIRKLSFYAFGLLLGLGFLIPEAQACTAAVASYPDECEIQDRFLTVKDRFKNFGINHDEITEYRTLRFANRSRWKKIELDSEKALPWLIYSPAPKTWLFWEQGEQASLKLNLASFQSSTLQEIHKQSVDIDLMSKWAILFKGAKPGKIRSSFWQIPPAFELTSADKINKEQSELIRKFDISGSGGEPLFHTRLRSCEDNSEFYCGFVLYIGSSRVPKELDYMMQTVRAHWQNLLDGKTEQISPIQLAALSQRWFVSIHPFGDGNGRTSRFVQDAIIRSFELPYPAAGDLHNDLFTPQKQYAKEMLQATRTSLSLLERCADEIEAFHQQGNLVSPSCQPTSHTLSSVPLTKDVRAEFEITKNQFLNHLQSEEAK